MCGRFTLKTPPEQWAQTLLPLIEFSAISTSWQPRYNIAPTQNIVAIAALTAGDRLTADYFRWGLVPNWAADLSIGNRMINARSETLLEKRSFKIPLEQRRCLVIADGYYEWQLQADASKQPFWISPVDERVLCFAGLWESNTRATGQPIRSCTIITTAANAFLRPIHDRMPAVLDLKLAARWLDTNCSASEAQSMLSPADDEILSARAVSKHVNNPRHEDAVCIEPLP